MNSIHLFFDYNPEKMAGGAWLKLFAYGGKIYAHDDEGVRLLGADSEQARKAAIEKVWPQVEEWDSIRLENGDVNHPDREPAVMLEECLRDEQVQKDDSFLGALPQA